MSKADSNELGIDERELAEITGDDVRLAARRAFTFLAACVDGEVAEASVGDRITAARSLLEHAARLPDLLGELADLASEDDVTAIIAVLD